MRLLEWRHGNEAAGMEAWEWDLGLPWISNINFTVTNMNNNLHMYNVCKYFPPYTHKHITTNTHTLLHTHTGAVDWVMMQCCFDHYFMLVLEKQERHEGHQQFFAVVQIIGTGKQAEAFRYVHPTVHSSFTCRKSACTQIVQSSFAYRKSMDK